MSRRPAAWFETRDVVIASAIGAALAAALLLAIRLLAS
jgi:hypothetical protein